MSRLGIFTIEGVEYDLDDLTIDEMAEIEQLAGASFGDVNYASATGLKAFTFVLVKRTRPDITMEEVGKIKVASMIPPDEVMPELPPFGLGERGTQSRAGDQPDESGPQLSVASTDG